MQRDRYDLGEGVARHADRFEQEVRVQHAIVGCSVHAELNDINPIKNL